jgi:hypothetical protein
MDVAVQRRVNICFSNGQKGMTFIEDLGFSIVHDMDQIENRGRVGFIYGDCRGRFVKASPDGSASSVATP